MVQIQTLKKNGESFYPMTHMKGVVDDNGNTMDVLLAEAEKRALRKLYIAAGAEYNDTDHIIKKTAFWGEEVDHLPKHYYLNGLGDITEEQMIEIYNTKDYMNIIISGHSTNVGRIFQGGSCPRTFKGVTASRFLENKSLSTGGAPIFMNNTIEVVKWSSSKDVSSYNNSFKLGDSVFFLCNSLRVIERCAIFNANSFGACPNLEFFEIHGLTTDFNISGSPSVKKTSILYTIENVLKTTTKSLVITLHADVYAKCIEGGEWYDDVNTALTTANAAITGGGSINIASA